MPGKVSKPRNRELISGINAVGRSLSSKLKRRNLFKVRGPNPDQKKTAKPVAHNAQLARFYAADDTRTPVPSRKNHRKPTALRASITPGTVLILLAGRFRGRRVVFLKQLASGLLLVTGPYKINGVPLRRVNQRYVIATSTKVDVKGVDTKKVSDHFFARAVAEKPKKDAENFFTENAKKKELSKDRREAQLTVDKALLASIKKVENLSDYLRARFSLTKGQYPHLLKF